MALREMMTAMRPDVETQLQKVVYTIQPYPELLSMLTYHMGWQGEGAGPEAQGKRIRPILVLLSAAAVGGDWRAALPAAASVELLHNFSLIHDDIQDQSEVRRGRPTVWKKWGVAQAINAGDLMFTLAQQAILELGTSANPAVGLEGARILNHTCVALTEGQYLDMANEQARSLPMSDYWPMVGGKTAALLSACAELGGLAAGGSETQRMALRTFGWSLGLAFQVLDDWLGIWGNAAKIGKSTSSDLVTGKKTLPVVYALAQGGAFARRWLSGPVSAEEVGEVAAMLAAEGAEAYTLAEAERLTRQSREALDSLQGEAEACAALRELADGLLQRQS